MTTTLTHIAMQVSDLQGCIDFYRDFCSMQVIHERPGKGQRIVWMSEVGREQEFIFVLMPGGQPKHTAVADYSHLGFAVDSREAVDAVAERARRAGCLLWEPREEPYPVGYYCGVRDPDGNQVEFSYGQPLGPGAEPLDYPPRG